MSKQTKKAKVPLKELPFMSSALPKLFNSGGSETLMNEPYQANAAIPLSESTNLDVFDVHSNRLDGVLKSWNFKRVPVADDGNCLFYAVAHSLPQTQKDSNTTVGLVERLGCTPDT